MSSRHFISKDAAPSNPLVTASVHIRLPFEETKHDLDIELYHLRFNELIAKLDLPLPEIVGHYRCTVIDLLLPSNTWQIGFTCLPLLRPSLLPNPTVSLNLDFILQDEGTYELRQRTKGIQGSERQQVFTVERVND
jgi:hypothetical protein